MNAENTSKKEKNYMSNQEVRKLKKSDYYREYFKPYIGQAITVDVQCYKFLPHDEEKNRACLRKGRIVKVEGRNIPHYKKSYVEHVWVYVNKSVVIDPHKPIRVVGIPYEYPHLCGNTQIRNVGLRVIRITQDFSL